MRVSNTHNNKNEVQRPMLMPLIKRLPPQLSLSSRIQFVHMIITLLFSNITSWGQPDKRFVTLLVHYGSCGWWLVKNTNEMKTKNKNVCCFLSLQPQKKKKQTKIFLTHLQVNSFSPKHISRQSRRELALVLRLT